MLSGAVGSGGLSRTSCEYRVLRAMNPFFSKNGASGNTGAVQSFVSLYVSSSSCGEVAERLKAAVLKIVVSTLSSVPLCPAARLSAAVALA